MGLRTHLVTMHTHQAEHHRDCAKAHDAYAKTLDEGAEKEFHKTMRDSHLAHAEKCVAHARSASELQDSIPTGDTHGPHKVKLPDGDLTKLVPDGVHGTHGGVPSGRLVGRAGADPMEIERANAEDKLEKLPAFARRDTSAA